jgi:hypothetical protein
MGVTSELMPSVMRTTTPSLPQLVDRLRRAVALQAADESIKKMSNEIARRLDKKQDRFRSRYRLPIDDWASAIRCSPISVDDFLEVEAFSILLKRDIDIFYFYGKERPNLWGKLNGQGISSKMYKDRLLILNPYAMKPNELQSWSRPSFVSRTRPEHLAKYKNLNKSRYLASVAVDNLELQAFNAAIGQVVNENTIHFYTRFGEVVGHLRNGSPAEHARIECTREPRKKGSGFRVQLHSYPVGMEDISTSALPSLRRQLEVEEQFKVPRVA